MPVPPPQLILKAAAYVKLNLVKAKMVKSAWDYRCSSVYAYIRDKGSEFSVALRTSRSGLVVLRSLDKFFGLAGARVGFVCAQFVLERRDFRWFISFTKGYGFLIGQAFVGVIGVGFYLLLGTRVWCRFGCPIAAYLILLQRYFSRFRITTNGGQCISCGNCSTYCEMGIDVKSYAQRGENIVRASCVGCGICSTVRPRGVLKLENGSTHTERENDNDNPITFVNEGVGLREGL